MGWIPNFQPSRSWFAGRMFFFQPLELIKKQEDILHPCLNDLVAFYEAGWNILRGIRVLYSLQADIDHASYMELLKELETLIPSNLFADLNKLLLKEFRIRFFYSSAGGYEIFAVLDTEKMEEITSDHYPTLCPKSTLEKIKAIPRFKEMLKLAYEERIDNLESCLSTAIDIFGHCYMKSNSEELGYGFEPIYHSDHECYEIIVDQGLAEDI